MPEAFSRVYFRADGDSQLGLGHLYRCLNLARHLKGGVSCEFLIERAPESFRGLLARERIRERLLAHGEAAHVHGAIARQMVVLDGPDFDREVMRRWREGGNLVAVIDDWGRGFFDCDVVVSHGPQNRAESYRGQAGCRYLVGPEYALLHPAFFQQPARLRDEVRRVLVAFGGGDAGNLTRLALEALDDAGVKIDVVLGTAYPHVESLAAWRAARHIVFHQNLDQVELAALMARADAAVAAGGGMSLELCAVGVPTLLAAIADNQVQPCEAFAKRGMAAYCGRSDGMDPSRLRRAALEFFEAHGLRRRIEKRNRTIFLTSGVERVSHVLCELMIDRAREVSCPVIR